MQTVAGVSAETYLEVQIFLFHEAELLEENNFEDWLALFTVDARYEMPVRRVAQPRPGVSAKAAFALYHDDLGSLTMRVRRLQTGLAHAEQPASVTQRLITNVQVEACSDGSFDVRSRFLVYQERRGRHGATFYGQRRDLLRREAGHLKIAARHIKLAQAILPTTISIFF